MAWWKQTCDDQSSCTVKLLRTLQLPPKADKTTGALRRTNKHFGIFRRCRHGSRTRLGAAAWYLPEACGRTRTRTPAMRLRLRARPYAAAIPPACGQLARGLVGGSSGDRDAGSDKRLSVCSSRTPMEACCRWGFRDSPRSAVRTSPPRVLVSGLWAVQDPHAPVPVAHNGPPSAHYQCAGCPLGPLWRHSLSTSSRLPQLNHVRPAIVFWPSISSISHMTARIRIYRAWTV